MPAIWIPKRLVEIDLVNMAAREPEGFVAHCDEEYEARVDAVAGQVLDRGSRVVMLTGPSASGKTTTSHKLAAAIELLGSRAQVVSLDDFYRNPEDYPKKADGTKDYESIDSLDTGRIESTLAALLRDGESPMPRFDFKEERRRDGVYTLKMEDGVLVVEGIHALNPRLTDGLPPKAVCRVYAGLREEYAVGGQRALPTRDIRLVRRMVRDARHRGHSPEKTMQMWGEVCRGEDLYIKVFKPLADILLDTSFSCEIGLLAPEVASLRASLGDSPTGRRLDALAEVFARCSSIPLALLPENSMLREFLG